MAKRKPAKTFFDMTPAERDADVVRFDRGMPFDQTRALSPAERARWERARNGGRRRAESGGGVPVIVHIDPKLLARAHAAAKRDGMTLSEFISQLLSKGRRRAG